MTNRLDTVLANDGVCDADCTLREAINAANANGNSADQDLIQFNITGDGPHRIQLTSHLPHVTQSVLIDGETEPGSQCAAPRSLMIEISGEGLYTGLVLNHASTLADSATGSEVRGLVLNRSHAAGEFTDFTKANGLTIANGTGHAAECLNVGTNVAGDTARGNARHGIAVLAPATNVRIGGNTAVERNIISSNGQNGISIGRDPLVLELVIDAVVQGNYIGVGIDGVTALGNSTGGISVSDAEGVEIGGTGPGEGNVLSGSGAIGSGINIGLSRDIEIVGNHIGVSADGTVAVPNSRNGIFAGSEQSNLRITGLVISHNVIAGNQDNGIDLWDGVPGAKIYSNTIGLNAAGTAALGNGEWGIRLVSSVEAPVNATEIGVDGGNVISGNGEDGIYALGNTEDTIIQNNIIGYAANGTTEIPNDGHGIWFFASLEQVGGLIGGDGSMAQGNVIYAEASGPEIANGIVIEATQGSTVSPRAIEIGANSIRSEGHAINLKPYPAENGLPNFATENDDAPDADAGPNRLQNHPIIESATPGDTPDVELTLESAPNTLYYLRFYASATCDDDNARQAGRFLERHMVSTNASGIYSDTIGLEADVAEGEFITVTATSLPTAGFTLLSALRNSDTSELSNCMVAGEPQGNIDDLEPGAAVAGTESFELQVLGTGFPGDSVIVFDGTPLTTQFFSSTELRATVTRTILGSTAGNVPVKVTASGGFETSATAFQVLQSSSDVNCNGTANAQDGPALMRILAGLEENQTSSALDPNEDSELDILDLLWVRQEVSGLIANPFPMSVK